MQQFAFTTISPRSFAWLIPKDDWEHLRKVIQYNSAMIGGYFNVFIPLEENGSISAAYRKFLSDFDPDILILAPDMEASDIVVSGSTYIIYPFYILPWKQVGSVAAINPMAFSSSQNSVVQDIITNKKDSSKKWIFSAFDSRHDDIGKLSLLICGDVSLTRGYESYVRVVIDSQETTVYSFMETDYISLLNICIDLQANALKSEPEISSFVNTSSIWKNGWDSKSDSIENYQDLSFSAVIIVSNNFTTEEAALFWNLRAQGFLVGWIPIEFLENETQKVIDWVDRSDWFGLSKYLILEEDKHNIVFATSSENIEKVRNCIAIEKTRDLDSILGVMAYHDVIKYNYIKPAISIKPTLITEYNKICTFLPDISDGMLLTGTYAITLDWKELIIPRFYSIVKNCIALNSIPAKYRINKQRMLRIQFDSQKPIEFIKPALSDLINAIILSSEFIRIEPSSTARYHVAFIERAGGLDKGAHYLSTAPYQDLFELLSNNTNKSFPGWLLDNPAKRRVLHHLDLRQALGSQTSGHTRDYFDKDCDLLPKEIINLLEQSLLERGFLLECRFCSYKSWYSIERVSETFECLRCSKKQIYTLNPICLYKMPEVVFQGFCDNMQVPLLSLNYMKRRSKYHFDWIPDFNIFYRESGKEKSRNIDIACISDGKIYIGEAKNNNDIPQDQFEFYEMLAHRIQVDGVIFSTSTSGWVTVQPSPLGNVIVALKRPHDIFETVVKQQHGLVDQRRGQRLVLGMGNGTGNTGLGIGVAA